MSNFAIYTRKEMLAHKTPPSHIECAERLKRLQQMFDEKFPENVRIGFFQGDIPDVARVHDHGYINKIINALPDDNNLIQLDSDTYLSAESYEAAQWAVGAGLKALEDIKSGEVTKAFCAGRPPGHHAERDKAMGFCLFNNIAVIAATAIETMGYQRVAMIDFDVHHGNGTERFVKESKHAGLYYASTHQYPLFPGTGTFRDNIKWRVRNIALLPGSGSKDMREAYTGLIADDLKEFKPDLLLISAGFDAVRGDPSAHLMWEEADFAWLGEWCAQQADLYTKGQAIAVLEGGYNLDLLPRDTEAFLRSFFR